MVQAYVYTAFVLNCTERVTSKKDHMCVLCQGRAISIWTVTVFVKQVVFLTIKAMYIFAQYKRPCILGKVSVCEWLLLKL